MEMLLIIGVFASIVVSVAVAALVLRNSKKPDPNQSFEQQQILTQTVSQMFTNLTGSLTKSSADIRQEISDKMNDRFTSIGKDLREELSKTTLTLEMKFQNLEGIVNGRLEKIGVNVQEKLDKNMTEGFSHFQKVQEALNKAELQLNNLNNVGQSIQELNNALNLPHLRGKLIGEGSLERLLANFLPVGYYEAQFQIDGALVDFVIKFPHLNLVLPIDSKFNYEQVSALYENNPNAEDLAGARKKLSEIIKVQAKEIKSKYIKPKFGTTDYALMYLPSETLYFEVVRDADLWGQLASLKVFPISPNTLAVTVNSIGKALQYYEMAKGVQKTIRQIQLTKDHLDDFKKRFEDIGEKLGRAQDSYNKANTHLSNYSGAVDKLLTSEEATKLEEKTRMDGVGAST